MGDYLIDIEYIISGFQILRQWAKSWMRIHWRNATLWYGTAHRILLWSKPLLQVRRIFIYHFNDLRIKYSQYIYTFTVYNFILISVGLIRMWCCGRQNTMSKNIMPLLVYWRISIKRWRFWNITYRKFSKALCIFIEVCILIFWLEINF